MGGETQTNADQKGLGRKMRSTRECLGFPTQTRRRGFNFYSKMPTKPDSGVGGSGVQKPRPSAPE